MQDCSISIANALEILQSCIKLNATDIILFGIIQSQNYDRLPQRGLYTPHQSRGHEQTWHFELLPSRLLNSRPKSVLFTTGAIFANIVSIDK